jgi:hypothetical protein
VGGEVVTPTRHDRAAVLEHRVVVDHQSAVRRPPDVELDTPGAGGDSGAERLDRVLPRQTRRAAMSDHQDHGVTLRSCDTLVRSSFMAYVRPAAACNGGRQLPV